MRMLASSGAATLAWMIVCAQASAAPDLVGFWPRNPRVNVPVCVERFDQTEQAIVTDGDNGAIIVWLDQRASEDAGGDVWAQHVRSRGAMAWAHGGVPVIREPGSQTSEHAVSDGHGGVIVAWWDSRVPSAPAIYAQHLDRDGRQTWKGGGVLIDATAGYVYPVAIATDNEGGAIIVCADYRDRALGPDLYAQRVDPMGTPLWSAGGVPVCTAQGSQEMASVVSDRDGSVFVTWRDTRAGGSEALYVQKLDRSGNAKWEKDGALVASYPSFATDCGLLSDGAGGAFLVWPSGDPSTLLAQRFSAAGSPSWQSPGVALTVDPWPLLHPELVEATDGGFIVTWQEARNGSFVYSAYAQRVTPDGSALWGPSGVELTTHDFGSQQPRAVPDGAGGMIAVWEDYRDPRGSDIFAQRVTPNGTIAPGWPRDGLAVSVARGSQLSPVVLAVEGGAIVAWHDFRGGLTGDIYAQRVSLGGRLGPTSAQEGSSLRAETTGTAGWMVLELISANPSVNQAEMAVSLEEASTVHVDVYNVAGQLVRRLFEGRMESGRQVLHWDLLDSSGARVSSGMYTCRLDNGRESLTLRGLLLIRQRWPVGAWRRSSRLR